MLLRFGRHVFGSTSKLCIQQPAIIRNDVFVRCISQTNPAMLYDDLKDDELTFDLGGQQTPKENTRKLDFHQTRMNKTSAQKLSFTRKNISISNQRPGKPKLLVQLIENMDESERQRRKPRLNPVKTTKRKKSADVKSDWKPSKKQQSFDEFMYVDTTINLEYIRLPKEHWQFSTLMMMLKSRQNRQKENLMLIEGSRLIAEAIDSGLKLKYLIFSQAENIEKMRHVLDKGIVSEHPGKTTIIRVPQHDLSYWSSQTTCPGIIALFRRPQNMSDIWSKQQSTFDVNGTKQLAPITIICDQIREPNNLGSILRTCAAVACEKVIVMKGCADPWDIKALRGGCGAHFRTNIVHGVEWDQLDMHLPANKETSVFIADNKVKLDENAFMPHNEKDFKRKLRAEESFQPKVYNEPNFTGCKHVTLVIGGETEGVSSRAYEFMKAVYQESWRKIKEPAEPKDESSEKSEMCDDANHEIEQAEPKVESSEKSEMSVGANHEIEQAEPKVESSEKSEMSVGANHQIEQAEPKVESSERSEMSDDANHQIVPRNGVLNIPLGNGVESLNVGVATGIILFEIRRQLLGK